MSVKSLLVASILLLDFWSVTESSAEPPPIAGGVSSGEALFTRKGCFSCHGYSGQGAWTGPRLFPRTLPLEAFRYAIRNPSNAMPPYGPKILTDQEITQIHTYLQSLPQPKQASDIPLLKN
jgi:ubiquinol-cytochrome c reductase cytochrome c subunit